MSEKNQSSLHVVVYLAGRGVSSFGGFILLIALNVYVLERTHSPAAVSLLWIIPTIASVLVGSWIGSVTDRASKRTVMMVMDVARAGLLAVLPLVQPVWSIYAIDFLAACAGTVFNRASMPYMVTLVPESKRMRVNAVNGMLQTGALVVGPAAAGALLLLGSPRFAIWVDAASFAVSVLTLGFLPDLRALGQGGPSEASARDVATYAARGKRRLWPWSRASAVMAVWFADLRASARYLAGRGAFLWLLSLQSLFMVFGQATDSQEVVFATRVLHLRYDAYSLLVSTAGIGYLIGAALVAVFPRLVPVRFQFGAGLLMGATGFFVYSLSRTFIGAVVGFVVLGVFLSLAGTGFATYYQGAMPAEWMGRVGNLTTPAMQFATAIMTVLAGVAAQIVGVRVMTVTATSVLLVVGLLAFVTIFLRSVRKEFARHAAGVASMTAGAPGGMAAGDMD